MKNRGHKGESDDIKGYTKEVHEQNIKDYEQNVYEQRAIQSQYNTAANEAYRKAMSERYYMHQRNSQYARDAHKAIEKWDKSPVTRFLTLANKAKDKINKYITKLSQKRKQNRKIQPSEKVSNTTGINWYGGNIYQ